MTAAEISGGRWLRLGVLLGRASFSPLSADLGEPVPVRDRAAGRGAYPVPAAIPLLAGRVELDTQALTPAIDPHPASLPRQSILSLR